MAYKTFIIAKTGNTDTYQITDMGSGTGSSYYELGRGFTFDEIMETLANINSDEQVLAMWSSVLRSENVLALRDDRRDLNSLTN